METETRWGPQQGDGEGEGVMVWRSGFLAVSASKQQYDLAPSLPLSKLSFLTCKIWVVGGEKRGGVLEPGIRVTLENWLRTLPHFLSGYFHSMGLRFGLEICIYDLPCFQCELL